MMSAEHVEDYLRLHEVYRALRNDETPKKPGKIDAGRCSRIQMAALFRAATLAPPTPIPSSPSGYARGWKKRSARRHHNERSALFGIASHRALARGRPGRAAAAAADYCGQHG